MIAATGDASLRSHGAGDIMRKFIRTGVAATLSSLALISIGGGIDIARAADIPVKAPAAVPAIYSWSGFYVGAHAGYGWMRSDTSLDATNNGVPVPVAGAGDVPDRFRINSSGFIGGGQVGINQQINRSVLGIEADVSYSAIKGGSTITGLAAGMPIRPFLSEQSQRLRWLATLRGRLGYLWTDAVLLYATGGLAIGRLVEQHHLQFSGPPGGTDYVGQPTSATRAGWTVGAGGEYRLGGNWTVKLEYLYFDLGKTTVVAIDAGFAGNPFQQRAHFDHTGHIARIGINYRFGGP
jgi:outer membrane immunogenic protein